MQSPEFSIVRIRNNTGAARNCLKPSRTAVGLHENHIYNHTNTYAGKVGKLISQRNIVGCIVGMLKTEDEDEAETASEIFKAVATDGQIFWFSSLSDI